MKTKLLGGVVVYCLMTFAAHAQTPAEQLQRAIFAQDAQGNIDSAIATYRQLANSPFAGREVAAYAQYKLTDALLQKGDVAGAGREYDRMRKDFAEYRSLIDSLAASAQKAPGTPPTARQNRKEAVPALAAQLGNLSFASGPFVETIRGKVTTVQLANPSYLVVDAPDRSYVVLLAPFRDMVASGKISKTTFKLTESVIVDARRPAQGPQVMAGVEGLQAHIIRREDGSLLFDDVWFAGVGQSPGR